MYLNIIVNKFVMKLQLKYLNYYSENDHVLSQHIKLIVLL